MAPQKIESFKYIPWFWQTVRWTMGITLVTRINCHLTMFLVVKSFFDYSNGHSDLHFLTLTAKMHIVEIVNIVISKNRIFGFSVFFSLLNTDVGFGFFKYRDIQFRLPTLLYYWLIDLQGRANVLQPMSKMVSYMQRNNSTNVTLTRKSQESNCICWSCACCSTWYKSFSSTPASSCHNDS